MVGLIVFALTVGLIVCIIWMTVMLGDIRRVSEDISKKLTGLAEAQKEMLRQQTLTGFESQRQVVLTRQLLKASGYEPEA